METYIVSAFSKRGAGGTGYLMEREEKVKLDHFVVNVDKKYQQDKSIVEHIRNKRFPYEPTWGKGTKGFKVSDLWIGNEYLEMVRILKKDGGGWVQEWTNRYLKGHRGMICFMFDVEDIDKLYERLTAENVAVTTPEWLEFKWFFNLLTRRMPWRNCYLPFFEGVPFQIGFQQMKDEEAREFMNQYMVPNSRDNGIYSIHNVIVKGPFTQKDFELITIVFGEKVHKDRDAIKLELSKEQTVQFIKSECYQVELYTDSNTGEFIEIENIRVYC